MIVNSENDSWTKHEEPAKQTVDIQRTVWDDGVICHSSVGVVHSVAVISLQTA